MEICQIYNIPKIVEMFEKNWGRQFYSTSHASCECLFKDCVFRLHINPQHATAIVEQAKHLIFKTLFDANGTIINREISYPESKFVSEHKCVLRTQPKGSNT